jgi:HlyD family secretion protein
MMVMPDKSTTSDDVQTLLGAAARPRWWRRPLLWGGVAMVMLAAGGVYVYQMRQAEQAVPAYVTESLRQGDITLTVTANGTLQPTRLVNVGSELSGTVREVLVDVNDRVTKGQVLVVLDTAKLQDQVSSSRAAVAAAQAQVSQAVATLKEARAVLARQEEVARLSGGKVPSAAELDTARAAVERAEASESSARAAVLQAQATLSTNETNLSKASIRSPIDGVVLTRTVEPGNAVAASLQAVTLFSIAQSLSQLQLEVYVDEADVGSVKVGQKASFTVSAYPNRRYPATISRVNFGSTKTENVVTYVTTLEVDNADLSLRPGMTANASIVATERQNVLLVPNAALRFNPASGRAGASGADSVLARMMPRPSAGSPKTARTEGRGGARQIWVLQNGEAVAQPVVTGISDGRNTEVQGDGLKPGLEVITGLRSAGGAR